VRTKQPEHTLPRIYGRSFHRRLLDWFFLYQRDLPWRKSTDPYSILVSEVMLQQTQVQTVLPYYARFLARFPTVEKLAAAEPNEVLRLWAGLGYYSRANNLQKAAQIIVRQFGGGFPVEHAVLLSLPGVGCYTAAAIMSIAFGKRFAVLDGNVVRVLSRLFSLRGDPKSGPLRNELWNIATKLVPKQRPGDFNQALMELGATVCLPKAPRCEVCPVAIECSARKTGRQEAFPEKTRRTKIMKVQSAAVLIVNRGRYLIVQRPRKGILQDFWEFPSLELSSGDDASKKLVLWLNKDFGLLVKKPELFSKIKHTITHRQIHLQVFRTRLLTPRAALSEASSPKMHKWIRLSQAWRYPFASAGLQILGTLQESELNRT